MQINRTNIPHSVQPKNNIWRLIDLVYPPICCCCGILGFEVCADCFQEITLPPRYNVCDLCGASSLSRKICNSCHQDPPDFDQLRSWGLYTGNLQTIIQAIKYKRSVGLIEYLKYDLAKFIQSWEIAFDFIVPVPLGKKRRRDRGFNQSEKIAQAIGKTLDRPIKLDALERIRETRTQVGLNNLERKQNVRDAFRAKNNISKGKNILLIDDIATTGATLNACSKALRMGGAVRVFCFTVAKTNND